MLRLGSVLKATVRRWPVASYSFCWASVNGSSLMGKLGRNEGNRRQTIAEYAEQLQIAPCSVYGPV